MAPAEFQTKLMTDAAFRGEFKKDPKAAMAAAGMEVPEEVEIEVVESTPTKHYIVLPPLREGELTDEDLAAAQGGCSVYAFVTGTQSSLVWNCS